MSEIPGAPKDLSDKGILADLSKSGSAVFRQAYNLQRPRARLPSVCYVAPNSTTSTVKTSATLLHKPARSHRAVTAACAGNPLGDLEHLMHRAHVQMVAAMERHLAAHPRIGQLGLTVPQCVVVLTLGNGPVSSTGDLCRSVAYDSGAMTRMVDRLEGKGLLSRARSRSDRRSVELQLTALGKEMVPEVREISRSVSSSCLRNFSMSEVFRFEQMLTRMLASAAEAKRAAR
ncbi:MAG TPA: MarR family winged helix-turn-helix transcriptional regulator [Steroidobacteraceae bacterium]|nr:MarR family winged helix-turn-helix transcriptional regulator [Steroidobacteraceae bacterium]